MFFIFQLGVGIIFHLLPRPFILCAVFMWKPSVPGRNERLRKM